MPADFPRYRFADLVVSSEIPLVELPAAAPDDVADVLVRRSPGALPEPERWFQVWTAGGSAVRFGRTRDAYLVEFPAWARVQLTADASQVIVDAAGGASAFELRHLLLNQVLPLVISRRGRLVIHASAVSWQDGVIAFVGRTHAGKSTMAAACAALGAAFVTDDGLVLQQVSGRWCAVPSYPGVRVRSESLNLLSAAGLGAESTAFESRTLPVERIFLISVNGAGVERRLVRGATAAVTLASHLFRLDVEDADESRRLFDAVTDLARQVPLWTLSMGRGSEGLARAGRMLTAEVARGRPTDA